MGTLQSVRDDVPTLIDSLLETINFRLEFAWASYQVALNEIVFFIWRKIPEIKTDSPFSLRSTFADATQNNQKDNYTSHT